MWPAENIPTTASLWSLLGIVGTQPTELTLLPELGLGQQQSRDQKDDITGRAAGGLARRHGTREDHIDLVKGSPECQNTRRFLQFLVKTWLRLPDVSLRTTVSEPPYPSHQKFYILLRRRCSSLRD